MQAAEGRHATTSPGAYAREGYKGIYNPQSCRAFYLKGTGQQVKCDSHLFVITHYVEAC